MKEKIFLPMQKTLSPSFPLNPQVALVANSMRYRRLFKDRIKSWRIKIESTNNVKMPPTGRGGRCFSRGWKPGDWANGESRPVCFRPRPPGCCLDHCLNFFTFFFGENVVLYWKEILTPIWNNWQGALVKCRITRDRKGMDR